MLTAFWNRLPKLSARRRDLPNNFSTQDGNGGTAANSLNQDRTAETPKEQLPVVRVFPPGVDINSDTWFLELLTVPESERQTGRIMTRISLREGDYVLPSFRFLSIVAYRAKNIDDLGIRCAQPDLMALANLLENPVISSAPTGGTSLKRSNKDLGRVLAIAQLTGFADFSPWMASWLPALKHCFSNAVGILGNYAGRWVARVAEQPRRLRAGVRQLRKRIVVIRTADPDSIENRRQPTPR